MEILQKIRTEILKRAIFLVSFFISLFLMISVVFAQGGGCAEFEGSQCTELRWEEVLLQSGEVAEIVIAPSNPNIVYAGFEVNSHSLYKSTDAGKTWKIVNGGGDHTKDVAVSPNDPDKVYFAMSEPLETTDLSFRSNATSMFGGPNRFGGETQVILSTGVPPGGSHVSFSSVEVFEGDDAILYAARKGGSDMGGVTPKIYKSVNGGQSWSEVEPDLSHVNVLAIHPTNHTVILIGSADGIYLSQDSGQTLTKLQDLSNTVSLEFEINNPNIMYAGSGERVLKSSDGGRGWQDVTGNLKDIHRVRVSRSHPNILYASTFNGVFRSDDKGASWRDVSGDLKAKNIQIVEIHPQNPDIAFIGHSSLWSAVRSEDRYRTGLLAHQGIFKTEDGGKTWVRSDTGIKEYKFEEVAINPNKPYEAWVLSPASRGGYKTEDAGHNWRLTQTPTFHYPMRVKYSMQNPEKVYATGWQNQAVFSVSEDGGVNWDLISAQDFFNALERGKHLLDRNAQTIHVHGLAVDPTNDKIVYAGSVDDAQNPVGFLKGAHIFKSTDGGNSWKESDEGFAHEQEAAIHDVTINPKNPNTLYVSTTRHEAKNGLGVYKSIDAGESWQAVNNGLSGESLSVNTLIIHPDDTNRLIIATYGGLYISENGGSSWERVSSVRSFDVEYVIDDPNIVYASTDDGVLKSRDFGDSWYSVNYGLPLGGSSMGDVRNTSPHFGAGIGVDKTGQVIYAAFQDKGLFVARLAKISPQEPISEFGESPYSFGPLKPGGFDPFTPSGRSNLLIILAGVTGVFIALILVIIVAKRIRKRKVSQQVWKR